MLIVIRAILISTNLITVGTAGTLISMIRPFYTGYTHLYARCFGYFGAKILGLKITVNNRERIEDTPSSVYVSNHQNNIDLFVCGNVIRKRTVSVGKKSLKFLPFFGQLYWLTGNILIDRDNVRKSLRKMDQATDKTLKEKNTSIWIFPEGTRNSSEKLLPFKRGAFRTAIKSQVPIIPICISSYAKKTNFHRFRAGKIDVTVLEPIPTTNLKTRDAARLALECQERIQETLNQMNTKLK